ncbi:MAG: MerR family transcriptional regulator [Bacteroidetes bacterium]|uniref:MerR family transcriptional regulator n=1 Tax=Phaeocystidibacter marisrubri TaxID=1577780 RepID=A0A6L3ZH67_9FLAO|nr:MerR family transcriptional regulator [Phaeocystidibacter marisrubri]KAB2816963.1 MerR family transcriptional regulator [Phaeocystidibacter marisrubri]TNE28241.1 MAG: MerR family transcriptional regulator [Bacteroidota bacterium]GGH77419.1 transcriptional regulator [Phaeocystidibacter marisrubri]
MHLKLPELTKRYYTIGEVADIFGVNASLLRYWEKEFPKLQPKKNTKGNRSYTPKDIEQIHLLYHLVKERGFTIEGARKKLRENRDDVAQEAEVVGRLMTIREKLVKLKHQL